MRLGRKSEKLLETLWADIQPYRLMALALVLIAFLIVVACPVSADELLVNGGFEAGTTGWLVAGGQLSATQEYVHSGQFAASLSSSDAAVRSFYQDVIVQPGSNYTFSGWAIMDSSNINTLYFQMRFLSEDGESLLDTRSAELTDNSPEYRFLTVTEMAPSQAVRLQVKAAFRPASDDPTVAYFDDLSLDGPMRTPTPSPTPTLMPSPTPILTPSPTPTLTPSPTPILTLSPTPILTPSPTPYLTSAWPGQIVINEVMYNPAESGAEWIELFNRSETSLALIGWTISDNVGTDIIPSLNLYPGGFALVAANQTAIPLNFTGLAVILADGRIGNGLADSGDRLVLRDGTGKVIDALSYGDDMSIFTPDCPTVAKGHSLERRSAGFDTDQASDFAENDQPGPGTAWVGPTPKPTPTPTLTPTLTPTHTSTPISTPDPAPTLSLTSVPLNSAQPGQSSNLTPVPELPTTLPQTGDPELRNIFIAMILLGSILLFCGLWLWRRASW